jgi:hypothetical protein
MDADTVAEVRRHFAASPERVFAAFADPVLVARWLTPSPEISLTVAQFEFQVVGHYRFRYQAPGQVMVVGGAFQVLRRVLPEAGRCLRCVGGLVVLELHHPRGWRQAYDGVGARLRADRNRIHARAMAAGGTPDRACGRVAGIGRRFLQDRLTVQRITMPWPVGSSQIMRPRFANHASSASFWSR